METRSTIPTPAGSPPPLIVEEVGGSRTNVVGGIIAGVVAAVVCAALWATIVTVTGYYIGYVSVFIGLIVGWVMRKVGGKPALILGFFSAILTLVSVVLGDFLTAAPFVSQIRDESIFELLTSLRGLRYVWSSFTYNFEFTSLFFYALATYIGFQSAATEGRRGVRS